MDLHNLSLKQQLQGLKDGDFSSTELTSHYLKRIEKYDGELNSFITITAEKALLQAKNSDKRYAENKAYALDGIPLAHKDIFCTKDVLTTVVLRCYIFSFLFFTVYEKLDAQKMMLGKTNMDEFAMGSSNETSYFGPVKNPWNKEYVPGVLLVDQRQWLQT